MPIKQPHGLFEIGGSPLTNPGFNGDRQTIDWGAVDKGAGVYKWATIDTAVAAAAAAGKQLGVSIRALSSPPAWVIAAGAKVYSAPALGADAMVLPFDPVVQPALLAFTKALALHLDGKVDYITMGGMGYKTETYMPLPADIGYTATNAEFIASWVAVSNLIVDAYAANLHLTPFIIAAGNPFKDPGGQAAITSVVNHGLTYPGFGIMQWGLNANSNNGFFVNKMIQDNDAGRAGGFQMTGSETEPHVGGTLNGTLDQCLQAGANLGADFVEVYAQDGENPALQPVLLKYNAQLK